MYEGKGKSADEREKNRKSDYLIAHANPCCGSTRNNDKKCGVYPLILRLVLA
jgi:hypothetical protein